MPLPDRLPELDELLLFRLDEPEEELLDLPEELEEFFFLFAALAALSADEAAAAIAAPKMLKSCHPFFASCPSLPCKASIALTSACGTGRPMRPAFSMMEIVSFAI